MSRPDGYEQRTFAAREASERAFAEIERFEDEADTDEGDESERFERWVTEAEYRADEEMDR